MHQNRIRNTWRFVIATLLLFNLGVMLSPPVHAVGKTQYKAVQGSGGSMLDAGGVQRALDEQAAEGWEYVGSAGMVLIFKK